MNGVSDPVQPSVTPGLLRRLACFVYEGLVLFGLGLIPGAVGAILVARFGERYPIEHDTTLQVFAFVFFGVYFIGYWRTRGQTLPMQTWRIRLETAHGTRLGWGRALARYVASWVWIAPPAIGGTLLHLGPALKLAAIAGWIACYAALALLHPRRQFWHDALCGTRLVTTPSPAAA